MSALELDRHLLASSATRWDTAWRSYGWTPALEGARASRLEEAVPWGTRSARLDRPPRLSGPAADVLASANLARLGRAFLPMDGRLGFSLWGAVGESRVGSEWRVATHTVLLDEDAFRRLAGHPGGLLAPGGTPAPWVRSLVEGIDVREPAPLPPIRLEWSPALRDDFARARLAELEALVGTIRDSRADGGAGLAGELAHVYEALAAAVEGTTLRHVAVRGGGDEARALLRLVWLSLPLEDRLRVFYVSEQRRTERPPGHLLGLPDDEWGRYVPGDAWIPGASEPVGPVSPGRRHWAELVAAPDGLEAFRRADGRAERSGWRVVGADDLGPVAEHARWRREWEDRGPTPEAVEGLLRRERRRTGGPRAGAIGDALGRAVGEGARPDTTVGLLSELAPEAVESAVRGAVRALRGRGRLEDAGRVRAAATETLGGAGGPLARGLHRMVDRESDALRALLGAQDGPAALVRAAFRSAAAGDPVALELGRLAVAGRAWDSGSGARLAAALPLDVEGASRVAAELLLALALEGADARSVEAVAEPLLARLSPAVVAEVAPGVLAAAEEAPAEGVEALRRAVVLRASEAGGRELDGPVADLIRLGGRTAPPATAPAPWRALLDTAPAPWLSRGPVLEALAGALDAGRWPVGHPDATPPLRELASFLARRVLIRAGPGSLDCRQADALLRLLWLEGDGATATWLVGNRPDAAPAILAQLIAAPPPLELQPTLRDAFVDAVETTPGPRELEPLSAELRSWAPALHERAGLARSGDRFVPVGRA